MEKGHSYKPLCWRNGSNVGWNGYKGKKPHEALSAQSLFARKGNGGRKKASDKGIWA